MNFLIRALMVRIHLDYIGVSPDVLQCLQSMLDLQCIDIASLAVVQDLNISPRRVALCSTYKQTTLCTSKCDKQLCAFTYLLCLMKALKISALDWNTLSRTAW